MLLFTLISVFLFLCLGATVAAMVSSINLSYAVAPSSEAVASALRSLYQWTKTADSIAVSQNPAIESILFAGSGDLEGLVEESVGILSSLCLLERIIMPLQSILVFLVSLGQSLVLAGCALIIVGVWHNKRVLIPTGMWVIVFGTMFSAITFAVITPASVFVDDGCYTLSLHRAELLVGNVSSLPDNLQQCLDSANFTNVVNTTTIATISYINTVQNVLMDSFNTDVIGYENYAPLPQLYPIVAQGGNNTALILDTLTNAITPAIDFTSYGTWLLRVNESNDFSQSTSEWKALVDSTIALALVRRLMLQLVAVGDCESGFLSRLLLELLNTCPALLTSLGVVVWSTALSYIFFILSLIVLPFAYYLIGNGTLSKMTVAALACLASVFSFGFIAAVVSFYPKRTVYPFLIWYLVANVYSVLASGCVFCFVVMHLQWFPAEPSRRAVWAGCLGAMVALVLFQVVALGGSASDLAFCTTIKCQYQCGPEQIAGAVMQVVLSVLILLLAVFCCIFFIYRLARGSDPVDTGTAPSAPDTAKNNVWQSEETAFEHETVDL